MPEELCILIIPAKRHFLKIGWDASLKCLSVLLNEPRTPDPEIQTDTANKEMRPIFVIRLLLRSYAIGSHSIILGTGASTPKIWYAGSFAKSRGRRQPPGANSNHRPRYQYLQEKVGSSAGGVFSLSPLIIPLTCLTPI